MGLPGSGKTTLAQALIKQLNDTGYTVTWFNADEVRKQYDDWDFSEEGRIRQSQRMYEMSLAVSSDYAVVDFVCPLPVMRDNFQADFTVWVDTIKAGRFEDTNRLFVPPQDYHIRVVTQEADFWAPIIVKELTSINYRSPI